MRITILQENLNKGFSLVSKLVTNKTALPILNNILLTGEEGKLKLTCTNLEIGINVWLPAKKEKDGKFTIPAKDISEFIANLPPGKIEIEQKQEKIEIRSNSYRASFNGLSASEFPAVPSLKDKANPPQILKKFSLSVKEFITSVSAVCFSASYDEARPVLTGVRLSFTGREMQLVATDGYRLSLKKINLKEEIKSPVLIIPAKALMEVVRVISAEAKEEENKTLEIAIIKETNQVIFALDNVEIITRLLEGEFPAFEKIIPESSKNKAICDREEFNTAIKASSVFARRSANIIKLRFLKTELIIQANAPEVGENETKLTVDYQGEEIQIAFNYRFLQEFLNNFSQERFVLETSDPLRPGVFKGEKDGSFLHIIMPVRIQD